MSSSLPFTHFCFYCENLSTILEYMYVYMCTLGKHSYEIRIQKEEKCKLALHQAAFQCLSCSNSYHHLPRPGSAHKKALATPDLSLPSSLSSSLPPSLSPSPRLYFSPSLPHFLFPITLLILSVCLSCPHSKLAFHSFLLSQ